MSNIFCTDISRRRFFALNNQPSVRFELTSPYPIYTSKELNMRRKVEILKYSNNAQNSKTNNFTKKEIWSRLAKGNVEKKSQYEIEKIELRLKEEKECDKIPTSTTSCDVPGPPIMLYYDPSVPLYNYNQQRNYAISNDDEVIL